MWVLSEQVKSKQQDSEKILQLAVWYMLIKFRLKIEVDPI